MKLTNENYETFKKQATRLNALNGTNLIDPSMDPNTESTGGVSPSAISSGLNQYQPLVETYMGDAINRVPTALRPEIYRAGRAAVQQILATTTKAEAATAGSDLVKFTRQKIATVLKVYASSPTLQLFGVIPMKGTTARIFFKNYVYDSAFTASAPNIAVGDNTADLAKYNPDYSRFAETATANLIKFKYSSMDVPAVVEDRVGYLATDQFFEDAASDLDDADPEGSILAEIEREMMYALNQRFIARAVLATPTANTLAATFDATPDVGYDDQVQSEKVAVLRKIYSHAIGVVMDQIANTNKRAEDSRPEWLIIGPRLARAFQMLQNQGFSPLVRGVNDVSLNTSTIFQYGTITSENLTVYVDPRFDAGQAAGVGKFFLGKRPTSAADRGIKFMPHSPLQATRDHYDPLTGQWTKAMRMRYGIAEPNTGVNADSAQLGEGYGLGLVSGLDGI